MKKEITKITEVYFHETLNKINVIEYSIHKDRPHAARIEIFWGNKESNSMVFKSRPIADQRQAIRDAGWVLLQRTRE